MKNIIRKIKGSFSEINNALPPFVSWYLVGVGFLILFLICLTIGLELTAKQLHGVAVS